MLVEIMDAITPYASDGMSSTRDDITILLHTLYYKKLLIVQ
jgi:hypothetical protein